MSKIYVKKENIVLFIGTMDISVRNLSVISMRNFESEISLTIEHPKNSNSKNIIIISVAITILLILILAAFTIYYFLKKYKVKEEASTIPNEDDEVYNPVYIYDDALQFKKPIEEKHQVTAKNNLDSIEKEEKSSITVEYPVANIERKV